MPVLYQSREKSAFDSSKVQREKSAFDSSKVQRQRHSVHVSDSARMPWEQEFSMCTTDQ